MSKPKTPEQKPTAEEMAQYEIAKQQWQEYRETAPGMQEMFMRLTTGYAPDGEGGLKVADKQRVLNDDGSVRIDAGQADAAAGAQWNAVQNRVVNPNSGTGRLGNVGLMRDRIQSQGEAGTGARLGQQNNYIRGVENVVGMGRGQQANALQGMQGLAGQAANQAGKDAQNSFRDRSANRYMLGQVLGGVGAYGMNKYQNAKDARTPGRTMGADIQGYGGTPGINPIGNLNPLWKR